jgi:hypothetical protein
MAVVRPGIGRARVVTSAFAKRLALYNVVSSDAHVVAAEDARSPRSVEDRQHDFTIAFRAP